MSLSKSPYPLLSTGSTQEDRKSSIVDWDLKHQRKQTEQTINLNNDLAKVI